MKKIIKKILVTIFITCSSANMSNPIINNFFNHLDKNNSLDTIYTNELKYNNIIKNLSTPNFTLITKNENWYKLKINLKNTKININKQKGIIKLIIKENNKYCNEYSLLTYSHNNIFKENDFNRKNNQNIITLKCNKEYPIITYSDTMNKNITYIDIAKHKNPFKYNIVLDPGHGGKDFGASEKSINEKDIVLDIAKRMEFKLKEEGINVVYTRKDDTFIKLGERPNIANNLKSDLFVSIHINSNDKSYPEGISTYYYSPFNYQLKERKSLANIVQAILIKDFPKWHNKGVFTDKLKVLRCSDMPSVLIEFGFVSNSHDRQELSKPIIRERAAISMVKGINKYLKK